MTWPPRLQLLRMATVTLTATVVAASPARAQWLPSIEPIVN